jgi:alpha-tubulin suppressor-like RCC1 family protein
MSHHQTVTDRRSAVRSYPHVRVEEQVDRCEAVAVELLDDRLIVSASCGLAHTAAVSKYGDVLVWGNGRSGQLGLYEGIDRDLPLPSQLPPFSTSHLVRVVCGNELTLAITGTLHFCLLSVCI